MEKGYTIPNEQMDFHNCVAICTWNHMLEFLPNHCGGFACAVCFQSPHVTLKGPQIKITLQINLY